MLLLIHSDSLNSITQSGWRLTKLILHCIHVNETTRGKKKKKQEASILHIAVINSNVIAERLVMDAITKAV